MADVIYYLRLESPSERGDGDHCLYVPSKDTLLVWNALSGPVRRYVDKKDLGDPMPIKELSLVRHALETGHSRVIPVAWSNSRISDIKKFDFDESKLETLVEVAKQVDELEGMIKGGFYDVLQAANRLTPTAR